MSEDKVVKVVGIGLIALALALAIASFVPKAIGGSPTGKQAPLGAGVITLPPVEGYISQFSVAVIGDSVPDKINSILSREAAKREFTFFKGTTGGCPVVHMTQIRYGQPIPWAFLCPRTAWPREKALVRDTDPDLIVWWSGTENVSMRLDDGTVLDPGTARHRKVLREKLEAAYKRLTLRGAVLAIVEIPMHACAEGTDCGDNFNATVRQTNDDLRWLVAKHPKKIAWLTLNPLLRCRNLKCPATIDGIPVRPDSTHFTRKFAPIVARSLFDQLAAKAMHLRGICRSVQGRVVCTRLLS